jgi:hypothetical protein
LQEEGQGKLYKNIILQSLNVPNRNSRRLVVAVMGIQSRIRKGSIKKAMKRGGTKMKYNKRTQQSAIDGGLVFDAGRDCKVCKAKLLINGGILATVPKRAHHSPHAQKIGRHGA